MGAGRVFETAGTVEVAVGMKPPTINLVPLAAQMRLIGAAPDVARIQGILAGAVEHWAKQSLEIGRKLQESDRRLAVYHGEARDLGRGGWTLPLQFAVTAIPDLMLAVRDGEDFDELFREYFSVRDGEHAWELVEAVEAERSLSPWAPLLAECSASFRDERFRVIMPALFVVLEAVLASAANALDRKLRARTDIIKRRTRSRSGIDLLIWASVEGFVEEVYKSHAFSQPPPPRINRHWVLHGRDASSARDRLDALRLYQAIHTAATGVESLKPLARVSAAV